MKKRNLPETIILLLLGLLLVSCGKPNIDENQTVTGDQSEDLLTEPESTGEETEEEEKNNQAAGREIVLENEALRQCVYEQLGKEEESLLYEEELEDYKGALRYRSSFLIANGEDFEFVRTYFDPDTFYNLCIVFAPDISNWTRKQLQGLGNLKKKVRICSTEDTIPVEVLAYFTGTDELFFDEADITGEISADQILPDNIKKLTLYMYAPERYTNLLKYIQKSEVESLTVYAAYDVEDSNYFLLDQVAEMKNLIELNLDDSYIRVENPENLKDMKLQYLECSIDSGVDLSFIKEMQQLKTVVCAVTETVDLSPFLERDELSLRLRFCQSMIEFEEDIYPDGKAVIFPELDKELGWKEEDEDTENFLAIYQRFMDEGRKIECFSIRCPIKYDNYDQNMRNVRTFLRATVDGQIQILIPEGEDPDLAVFGDYRTDPVRITDINFDGVNDVMLYTGGFGNALVEYAVGWIWEEESRKYVKSETFGWIANPAVDTEQKLVRSAWRNSAASHSWAIYRYEDGVYKITSKMTESAIWGDQIPEEMQVSGDSEAWEWVEEIYDEDKNIVETNSFMVLEVPGEKTEYPEAYYKFYEPDSYWGGL